MSDSQKISDLAVALQETSVARDEARDSRTFSKEQWGKAILAHKKSLSDWHKAATPDAWLALRNEVLEEAAKAVIGAPVFGKKNDAHQDAKNIHTIDVCVKAIRALKQQRPHEQGERKKAPSHF